MEDSITLGRLHEVLQIVMGWQDFHLHQFLTGEHFVDQIFTHRPGTTVLAIRSSSPASAM